MTRLTLAAELILISLAVIVSGCGNGEDDTSGVQPERISLEEFKALFDSGADNIVIVDTRSLESYKAGHIPGAISMPYPDEIRARQNELPRDRMIILYCS